MVDLLQNDRVDESDDDRQIISPKPIKNTDVNDIELTKVDEDVGSIDM